VLFANMKGSMELLAQRDPEEAPKILDPVLERRMGALHRYEGTVGDYEEALQLPAGVIAVLALPLPAAALTVQEAVHRAKPAVVLISVRVEAEVTMNCGQGPVIVHPAPFVETGTGWFVDGRGYLITNGHVVEPAHRQSRTTVPRSLGSRPCGRRISRQQLLATADNVLCRADFGRRSARFAPELAACAPT